MPKVLLIADSLLNGGAERQLSLLVKCLPIEWNRTVWSLGGGPFADIIRSAGVNVSISKRFFSFDISPAISLWKIIKSWQPDVVHSWGWMATAAAGPICIIKKIPLVDGTIRMGCVPPRRGLANRWSMKWASVIVANSQVGLRAWGISSEKGRVIYNGFDPERLELCSEILPKLENVVKIVMTGRMVAGDKDFATFLDAARLLLNSSNYRWQFVAVGNGPDRQRLIDRNEDLIAEGQVVLIDGKTDVLPILRDAYVGVLVSHPEIEEGCSNSIMEYMACGLPVVCGDSGGNREVVLDGKTGFIIPAGNTKALAEKLLLLREDVALAQRMGAAGRERILRHFSVEKMVKSYVDVYNYAHQK